MTSIFNLPRKRLRLYEIQRNIPVSRACLNPLIYAGKSNGVKIRICQRTWVIGC